VGTFNSVGYLPHPCNRTSSLYLYDVDDRLSGYGARAPLVFSFNSYDKFFSL